MLPFFFLFVSGGIIDFAEEVVDTGVVEACEFDKNSGRNVVFAGFIFGITGLGHSEHFCNLGLVEITVFPHIADSGVHNCSPFQVEFFT